LTMEGVGTYDQAQDVRRTLRVGILSMRPIMADLRLQLLLGLLGRAKS
jgi:hypothetical protein